MAILITGGDGFIGQALAHTLHAQGEQCVLFDLPGGGPMHSAADALPVQRVEGDLRQAGDVRRALEAAPITHVVHAAAITPDAVQECAAPARVFEVNVNATLTLLQCCKSFSQIRRVLLLSSVAVYGFSAPAASGTYDEKLSAPCPASLYGISKLAAEQAARRLAQLYGIDLRIARLGPVFGPWERASSARQQLSPHHQVVMAALAGQEIVLPRPMSADWLYARDAAAALAAVLLQDHLPHRLYNVGHGAMSDVVQWCEALAGHVHGLRWRLQEAAQPEPIESGTAPAQTQVQAQAIGSRTIRYALAQDRAALGTARLQAATGFVPHFDLAQAAADYLAWLRRYPAPATATL